MKVCRICKEEKDLSEYTKNGKYIRTECTLCFNRSMRQNYANKTDEYTNRRLMNLYKISLEDYKKLFEEQKGCCAICETHQDELNRSLAVDHCHETGKVRGLLCPDCNKGLGFFDDNPALINSAIDYLRMY